VNREQLTAVDKNSSHVRTVGVAQYAAEHNLLLSGFQDDIWLKQAPAVYGIQEYLGIISRTIKLQEAESPLLTSNFWMAKEVAQGFVRSKSEASTSRVAFAEDITTGLRMARFVRDGDEVGV